MPLSDSIRSTCLNFGHAELKERLMARCPMARGLIIIIFQGGFMTGEELGFSQLLLRGS